MSSISSGRLYQRYQIIVNPVTAPVKLCRWFTCSLQAIDWTLPKTVKRHHHIPLQPPLICVFAIQQSGRSSFSNQHLKLITWCYLVAAVNCVKQSIINISDLIFRLEITGCKKASHHWNLLYFRILVQQQLITDLNWIYLQMIEAKLNQN